MELDRRGSRTTIGKRVAFVALSLCMAVVIPVAAAAEPAVKCSKGPWQFKDPESMKLSDGEHSLGKAQTPDGTLEVRVRVYKGEVLEPMYFLRGNRLQKFPDAKVPKELRECMGLKKTASLYEWIGPPMTATLDWLIPSAEARGGCKSEVVAVTCSQRTCCALAKCGRGRSAWCASY